MKLYGGPSFEVRLGCFNILNLSLLTSRVKFRESSESHHILAYGVKHKPLPVPIIAMFNEAGGKTHRYPTRQKNLPSIRKHKSDEYNKSFPCKTISNYNGLTDKIKLSNSRIEFINNYKKQLFDN